MVYQNYNVPYDNYDSAAINEYEYQDDCLHYQNAAEDLNYEGFLDEYADEIGRNFSHTNIHSPHYTQEFEEINDYTEEDGSFLHIDMHEASNSLPENSYDHSYYELDYSNTLGDSSDLAKCSLPGLYNCNEQLEETRPSRGSNPRNTHGIRLHPVSSLPDIYRGIFKFGVFNAVQSTCFSDVLYTNQNMVISAPTGSGKTVLFELSIIKMLTESRTTGQSSKCVYMAPTKALCSERYRDWSSKFDPLGVKCCELTGDTVHFGKGAWGDAKKASIIITTGEKWDSLTRNWRDHGQTLSQIQLFLVDEVHILNESRGSTLEVVVSRMKTHGSSVRFVLVSATVPNIDDIASWIGSTGQLDKPAKFLEFGEEFRPCKLTRFVVGVPRSKTQNDFAFTKSLDFKLFAVLQKHSMGKPILVFCSTRKGVFTTAEHLTKDYTSAEQNKQPLPWSRPPRIDHSFHDKRLNEFASFGIGVHHAGLTLDDRRTTEDLYLRRILRIIVATSTLAVGVNLPAHMVVIKGVQTFQNNTSIEYSDLDIMQMLGRAGRPQFDKDGIAIILCEQELENKYRTLVQGKTILESSLHTNLSEHLNSEVGLGTITNIASAKEWLRSSFLFQRIRKNPRYYAIGKGDNQTWEERVDDLVTQSVAMLRKTGLIETANEGDESGELLSTEYGDIMSKFYIRQSTMSLILALPERPTLREILEMISASEEFFEIKIRASEKTALNKLRKHNDIRFEIKKLEKASDKVFLLIQAVLGGISLNTTDYKSADSQPQLEAFGIFRHVSRIAKAIVEVAVVKKCGGQVKHGLELLRCLSAKAWEDRPVVLRQIEQIGEKSLKVLAEHGIVSLDHLRKQDAIRIETLLNRRPPFGLEVLASLHELPRYLLTITEASLTLTGGKAPIEVRLLIECGLEEPVSIHKSKKPKGRGMDMTAVLTLTSDMDLLDFRRIPTRSLTEQKTFEVTAELTKPSLSVMVLITSETIAGVIVYRTYKPKISPKEYPTLDTRPLTSTDIDLIGLEDDPDFWNMKLDDDDHEEVLIRDLTKPQNTEASKSSQNVHGSAMKKLNCPPAGFKRLVNGNYECNHSCKDKTKCRHLCCRDGLPEPSHLSKKKPITTEKPKCEPSNKTATKRKPITTKSKIATAHQVTDRKLHELETLHERTNVVDHLKPSKGHRLKLDSAEPRRKRNPPPEFKIEFSDLSDPRSTNPTDHDVNDTDDDENLPETHEIIAAIPFSSQVQTSPSDINYSFSDIDSLIRAAPLDIEDTYFDEPIISRESPRSDAGNLGHPKPPKPTLGRPSSVKRARSAENVLGLEKRARYATNSDVTHIKNKNQLNQANKTNGPLFAEVSDEELAPTYKDKGLHEYDTRQSPELMNNEFSLDSDHIDIIPDTPPLSRLTLEGETFLSKISTAMHFPKKDVIEDQRQVINEDIKANNEDELAEFDEWFSSGAVDII